jgi:hypothetical protein
MTIAITINIEIVQHSKYCGLDVTECEPLAVVDWAPEALPEITEGSVTKGSWVIIKDGVEKAIKEDVVGEIEMLLDCGVWLAAPVCWIGVVSDAISLCSSEDILAYQDSLVSGTAAPAEHSLYIWSCQPAQDIAIILAHRSQRQDRRLTEAAVKIRLQCVHHGTDEIWVEAAREKRRRQPTLKAAEAAKAKAEAEKAAMKKAAAAAAAQAEIDFWEL